MKLMHKMLWWTERIRREDLPQINVCDYHDLIRATEVQSITDCAEMAAKASLFRDESRWGLSHYRLACPKRESKWDATYVIVLRTSGTSRPDSSTNILKSILILAKASTIRRMSTLIRGWKKSTPAKEWKFPSVSSPRRAIRRRPSHGKN